MPEVAQGVLGDSRDASSSDEVAAATWQKVAYRVGIQALSVKNFWHDFYREPWAPGRALGLHDGPMQAQLIPARLGVVFSLQRLLLSPKLGHPPNAPNSKVGLPLQLGQPTSETMVVLSQERPTLAAKVSRRQGGSSRHQTPQSPPNP